MQVANRPLNTPAQVSANQTQNDKAQKTRERIEQGFLTGNRKEIDEFIGLLRGEAATSTTIFGNFVKAIASGISQGDNELEKNLILLFSKNLDINKEYNPERLAQKIAQIESALAQGPTTPVVAPSTQDLESAINKLFENASKSGVNLGNSASDTSGAKIHSLTTNLEAVATALNGKQSTASDAKGYFESFVSAQDQATNTLKLVKALNTVKASLEGEDVSAQALNDALGKIQTFNAAAE